MERKQLHTKIDWKVLPIVASDAPASPGIYFLGAPFSIRYPGGVSRVFYLGSSVNLRKRLGVHAGNGKRQNFLLSVFSEGDKNRIACSYFSFPNVEPDEIRAIENW